MISGKVITLCGSTKFKKEFEEWNIKLTGMGNVVFSVVCFTHADNLNISENEKEMFDKMHLKKIDLSDTIFVIDVNGYIGNSTKKEIEYARKYGKEVIFMSEFIKKDGR